MNKLAQEYRKPKSKSVPVSKNISTKEPNLKIDVKKPGEEKENSDKLKQLNLWNQRENIRKMQSDIISLVSLINKKGQMVRAIINAQGSGSFDLNQIINDITSESFKIDGKWGKQTTSALDNVYKFAAALLNVNSYYKLGISGYNISDFKNLRILLNGYEINNNGLNAEKLETQSQRAEIISTHIVSLINFFNDIVAGLEKDQRVKDDSVKLDEYKQRSPELTAEEEKLINENSKFTFSINIDYDGKNVQIPVPLKALENAESFDNWFKNNTYKDYLKPYEDSKTFFNKVIKQNKWV